MAARRWSRLERIEGLVFDVVLVGVAAVVAEDVVQAWLWEHPQGLYYGLSVLHLVAFPFLLTAIMMGWGRSERQLQRRGSGVLGWMVALYFGGSFIIPGALALVLDAQLWVMMTTVFGPLALFALVVGGLIFGERKGWWPPRRVGEPPPAIGVQALAFVSWAYLVWIETMMLVAASVGGPLGEVGLLMGVAINYVPVRIVLFYVRDSYAWERYTIAASILHLLWRLAAVAPTPTAGL